MKSGFRWISEKLQVEKKDCLSDRLGLDYKGEISRTRNNEICQRWDEDHRDYKIKQFIVGDRNHNHCRNPDKDGRGPWCYLKNFKNGDRTNFGYCKIPKC